MNVSLGLVFAIGIGYLFILFASAYVTERGWLPRRLVRHPSVYILSLGVYASAWAIYGSVGLANRYGYGYLTYYLGIAGAFVLAPVLLIPLLRITRTYQLSSLADLFAFRYRSQWVGVLVTLLMLMGAMPLLALQIKAVADAIQILTGEDSPYTLAFGFCCVITLFAILFGARHTSPRDKHESLVVAIALESLVKLAIMLTLGLFALYGILGGPQALEQWLVEHAVTLQTQQQPLDAGQWRTLLLLFFAAAVAMPHMFHMIFTENLSAKSLFTSSWALPLYLLLLSLPVPLILWAGMSQQLTINPEYFSLGIGLQAGSPLFAILAFIGGLSAASGTIIIVTLALAAMSLNHLVLPIYQPGAERDIYRWLLWARRLLIAMIILAGYAFYRLLTRHQDLSSLGITAFVGILQFLPGVLALLYWPTANRKGLMAGLGAGLLIWCVGMLIPLIWNLDSLSLPALGLTLYSGGDSWYPIALVSITSNVLAFVLVSLLTRISEEEAAAAEACSVDTLIRPRRRELQARTCQDFKDFLSLPLGRETAEREVDKALHDLQMEMHEVRPYALRRLRDRIEANLSGLMGPAIAQELVDRYLPYKVGSSQLATEDINYMETRLEEYHFKLTGLARELDSLRRYHRQTLQKLPIGACSLGADQEVLMWNLAMEALTGIAASEVVGSRIDTLPSPWGSLLSEFAADDAPHLYKKEVQMEGRRHWFSLHKAAIEDPQPHQAGGIVILLEDQTETRLLEEELVHSERLASIGRLAAGVAHEIGNPVTGISSLAQNLKYETEQPEVLETAEQILQQTKRISRIVQSLVNFAHAGNQRQHQEHQPVNVRDCLQEAINLISLSKAGKDIRYINRCSDQLQVIGDPQRLVQVFVNLLSNASDASEPGASVTLDAQASTHTVTINVTDEGSGIDPSLQEHLFEPFFTTKEPGQGTGLGLALVYSIVEEHYGHIDITSPVDDVTQRGTRIAVTLPQYHSDFALPNSESATPDKHV